MSGWGGRRAGAGRKRLSGVLRHSRTFSVTDAEFTMLKSYLEKLRHPAMTVLASGEKYELSECELYTLPKIIEEHRQNLNSNYKSKLDS